MPLPILGGTKLADTAFSVANSCRFNDDDDAYMHKTPGSAGNRRKFTFSTWLKRGNLTLSSQALLFAAGADTSNWTVFRITTTDELQCSHFDPGSTAMNLITSQKLRDPSAWYNIVVAVDTEQGTESNRVKIYINGTQVTAFGTETYPPEDKDLDISDDEQHYIGGGQSRPLDGYMAEVVFIDGSQLAPTSFGEFDEDSPTIWKPIDVSGLTFGTNGFYLDFEDSSNLGNDVNGGTDLTEVNLAAADQATDTPTNNFCTLNPLDNFYYVSAFSEGNCKIVTTTANYSWNTGTIALTAGKWYFENYIIAGGSGSTENMVGIAPTTTVSATAQLGSITDSYSYYGGGGIWYNGSQQVSSMPTYITDDVVGCAIDLDNNKIYWHKNGTYINSGDPTNSSTGTAITAVASTVNGFYFPAIGDYGTPGQMTAGVNFGGCPAIAPSSGNADANGYGNFEFSVPSGYLAICTKNLGSDGG